VICPVCYAGWGDEVTGPLTKKGLCPVCNLEATIARQRAALEPTPAEIAERDSGTGNVAADV
jgi:hypothetical protein